MVSSSFRLIPAGMNVLLIMLILAIPLVSSSNGDLRLAGSGSSQLAGRLEIYYNGAWGTVCARKSGSQLSQFNFRAATVACRQLGLGWAVEYYSPLAHFLRSERHRFGAPLNVVPLLDNVRCEGHEPHLLRCSTGRLGSPSSDCDYDSAVSITCSNLTTPYNGQVVLSHGPSLSQSTGVLRLYSNHQWGAVCSTGFTMTAAHAVCRQLGFTEAVLYREVTSYTGPQWNVESLLNCSSVVTTNPLCFTECLSQLPSNLELRESVSSSCTPVEVSCSLSLENLATHPTGNRTVCQRPIPTPQNGAVRLNRSSSSSSSFETTDIDPKGRVEVFFEGSWGTVCGDQLFLYKEADVVCKSLGYPAALRYGEQRYSRGDGSGDVLTVTCSGLEESVSDCVIERNEACSHEHDVDVTCSLAIPPYGSLAIRSGRGAEGALYIFTGPSAHPVCDHNFDLEEATVACRQLGYPGAVSVRPNGYYRGGSFADVRNDLYAISSCHGDEDYLLTCPSLMRSDSHCRPGLDEVAIVCGSRNDSVKDVRLVDGTTSSSGRLEIRLNGEWGSVCSRQQGNESQFSRLEAHVACQELDYRTVKDVRYISGPSALSQVSCSGFEESILDCKIQESSAERCTEVVALECTKEDLLKSDYHITLVDLNDTVNTLSSGRLQITYRGLNMSICGLLFTENDAQVVCRQLGFARMVEFCTDSCFGEGDGFIFLAESGCSGSEGRFSDCRVEVHHSDTCDHSSDVGIVCEGTLVTTSPPPTEPPSPTTATSDNSIIIYIIAGSSAGGVLLLITLVVGIIVCSVCCCYLRHKKKQNQGMWRSPNSTLTSSSRTDNSQSTDHPKLNNHVQNDLTSHPNSKTTDQAATGACGADDFDDPTEALEMKQMKQPNSSSSRDVLGKSNLFEDVTEHPSSLTIDSGYGVSNTNITYGPESPPPNYDELDLLPVATESVAAATASGSSTTKTENEGGFKNLSFRSKDGGDASAGDEKENLS